MSLGRKTAVLISSAALGLTACSAGTSGPSGGSTSAPAAPQTAIDVLNILPPGNATGPSQRAMYDALNTIDPSALTDAKLTTYYKSGPLDPAPGTVVKTEAPKAGVTIKRDKFGVPFVYGTTDDDTAYGAGYAGTEDRMFVMDALRYAGSGRRSELLGVTKDNLASDADLLRQADYTPAEANAQLDALSRGSAAGKDLIARLDSFVAGVNAARTVLCPAVTAATCPAPYRLLNLSKWDWTGFLPAAQHPQVIDPPSGFIVNWNNKPSVGTYSADDQWGWGPVQRMLALRDRIEASIKAGKLTRATLDSDMIDAATVDIRGAYVLKDMLAMVGDPTLKPYTGVLRAWAASGAHRVDRAGTGHYADQSAVALMDAWYPLVAKAVLRPRIGSLVNSIPTGLDDLPTKHGGSSFDNVGSYQWVSKDLETVLGKSVTGAMSQPYCGKGQLAACRGEIRQTLTDAVAALGSRQHTTNPAKWTYDKTNDDIQFSYVGDTVAPIDWRNRPTFQQVIG